MDCQRSVMRYLSILKSLGAERPRTRTYGLATGCKKAGVNLTAHADSRDALCHVRRVSVRSGRRQNTEEAHHAVHNSRSSGGLLQCRGRRSANDCLVPLSVSRPSAATGRKRCKAASREKETNVGFAANFALRANVHWFWSIVPLRPAPSNGSDQSEAVPHEGCCAATAASPI